MAPASSSPVAPVSDSQTKLVAAESSSRLGGSGALVREGREPEEDPSLAVSDEAVPGSPSPKAPPSHDAIEDSDVFVYERAAGTAARAGKREVTLFVHAWENVEPGLLSWTFPNLRAALDAVQRMKNAIGWCVVEGTGWVDLDSARAHGAILVEQI